MNLFSKKRQGIRQFSTDLGLISIGSDQLGAPTPIDKWSVKDEIVKESFDKSDIINLNLSVKERHPIIALEK